MLYCLLSCHKGWKHCGVYLFDCLALGDLRASNHLVWRADLNEGELRVLCNLCCQGCLSTVWRTWRRVLRAEERVQFTARPRVRFSQESFQTLAYVFILKETVNCMADIIGSYIWVDLQFVLHVTPWILSHFTWVHARDVAVTRIHCLYLQLQDETTLCRFLSLNWNILNLTVICTDLTALQHELNWKLYQILAKQRETPALIH